MLTGWKRAASLSAVVTGLGFAAGAARAQQWTPAPLPVDAGGAFGSMGSVGGLYGLFWHYEPSGSSGVWKLPWGSADWQPLGFAENSPVDLAVSGIDHRAVYFSCQTGDQRFFLSHDDGESWIGKAGPSGGIGPIGVDRQRPSVIYGARDPLKMYASTDEGDSWIPWDGGSAHPSWTDVAPAPLSARTSYALHTGSFGFIIALKTTNGGVSWQSDNSFPPEMWGAWGSLAVTPTHPDAVVVLTDYYLVENVGGPWVPHSLPGGLLGTAVTIPHWAPETVYVAGKVSQGSAWYPAAFKTTDFGSTWTDISSGLPQVDIGEVWTWVSLAWHPTDGTLALSYEYPQMLFFLQEEVSAGVAPPVADRRAGITLAPNPSRGPVVIRLRDAGHNAAPSIQARSIEIVDILGRRIRTLSARSDAGDPALLGRWNGETEAGVPASPGVYFVRLDGGGSARLLVVR